MTTDEQKLETIDSILKRYGDIWLYDPIRNGDNKARILSKEISKKILDSLKQFDQPTTIVSGIDHEGNVIRYEPLEVEIEKENDNSVITYETVNGVCMCIGYFNNRQKAIDFCKRHGLRVKK